MSATGRKRRGAADGEGTKRLDHDAYETPSWTVDALLDELPLPGGRWLEPCVGSGSIIRAVEKRRLQRREQALAWTVAEIRSECGPALAALPLSETYLGDFFEMDLRGEMFDVILTNPPFSLAAEFVTACLPLARNVVFLMRLAMLEGKRRAAFWRENMADIYILPNRPSFTGKGTDATAYAWFHWHGMAKRSVGNVRVLAPVSDALRRFSIY